MRDDTLAASQPPDHDPAPATPDKALDHLPHDSDSVRKAAPGQVLCRDGAYPGRVTAVRKAVERNAAFGC